MPDKKKLLEGLPVIDDDASKSPSKSLLDELPVIDETAPKESGLKKNTQDINPLADPQNGTIPVVAAQPTAVNPQELNNKIFGQDISGAPLVPVAKPIAPQEKTSSAISYLADDLTKNINQHAPELQTNLSNIPFHAPESAVNNITNPSGDPAVTGQYTQTRIAQLTKEYNDLLRQKRDRALAGELPTPEQDNALGEYATKLKELQNNAGHIIGLQLFNKEYGTNKLDNALAQTQLQAIEKQRQARIQEIDKEIAGTKRGEAPNGTEAIQKRSALERQKQEENQRFNAEQQKIKQSTKYDPIRLGAELSAQMGDKHAQEDLQKINEGKPIDPARQYKYNLAGISIIDEGKNNTINEHAQQEAETHKKVAEQELFNNNKSFLVNNARQVIGNKKYKDENSLIHAIIPSALLPDISKEEIEKYAKEEGFDKQITDELIKNPEEIPKSASLWQQAIKGMTNTAAPIYERGMRSLAYIHGTPSEIVEEHFHPGWENESGISSVVAGNMPSEQNSFKNVRGALGQIIQGAAGLSTFMGEVGAAEKGIEGLGLAVNAEKAANFGVMAFNGYNDAYQTSKEIIGDKPEDEGKRQLYSLLSGVITGGIFSIAPPTKLVKNALGEMTLSGEQLLNEIKSKGIAALETPNAKQKLANIVMEAAKDNGVQITLASANKIAENALNTVFDKTKKHDLTEGVADAAISTSLSMMIPSIMSGVGHARMQNPLNSAAAFEIGSNPSEYRATVMDMLAKGKITQQEARNMQESISTMGNVVKATPTVNMDGNPLTPDQVKDYAFSLLQENILQKKVEKINQQAEASGLTPDKAQLAPINKSISELQGQRNKIMESAGTSRVDEIPAAPEPEKNIPAETPTRKSELLKIPEVKQTIEFNEKQIATPENDYFKNSKRSMEEANEDPLSYWEGLLEYSKNALKEATTDAEKQHWEEDVKKRQAIVDQIKDVYKNFPKEDVKSKEDVSLNSPSVESQSSSNEKTSDHGKNDENRQVNADERKGQDSKGSTDENGEGRNEAGQDRSLSEPASAKEENNQPAPKEPAESIEVNRKLKIDNFDKILADGGGRLEISNQGENVPFKTFDIAIDHGSKTAEVVFVEKADPTKNKGIGYDAYVELGNRLAEKGITLESKGQAQYEPGRRLWDKLVKEGLAKGSNGNYEFISKEKPKESPKKKRKFEEEVFPEEKAAEVQSDERSVATEAQSEQPTTEQEKPIEHASPQTKEQQQEVVQQGSEPEHARAEQAGGKEKATGAKGSDSHIGGEKEKEVGPHTAIAQKQIGEYNAVRGKKWQDQQRKIESARAREDKYPEKIANLKEGTKKYNDVHDQHLADEIFLKHVEANPPVRSTRNQAKRGENVTARVKEKDKTLKNEPKTVEELVLQHLLAMDDKHPEDKFSKKSIGGNYNTREGSSERAFANQFVHENGKDIDKWAESLVENPEAASGLWIKDAQEIKDLVYEHITNFETKAELQKRLNEIHEQRIADEDYYNNLFYDRSDAHEASDEYAVGSPEQIRETYLNEEVNALHDEIDNQKITDAQAEIILPYLEKLIVDGKVDLSNVGPFDEGYDEMKQALDKETGDFIEKVLFSHDTEAAGKLYNKVKEKTQQNERAEPEAAAAAKPESENVTPRNSDNEGGGEERAGEEAKPEPPTKEVDEKILHKKAELAVQRKKEEAADKEMRKALQSGDNAKIKEATDKFNAIKDIVIKKEAALEKLNEERDDILQREAIKEREADIKEGYKATANKIREFGQKLTKNSEGMVGAFPGISPKLVGKFIDKVADLVERFGNLHAAIYKAIEWHNAEFKDEKPVPMSAIPSIADKIEYLQDPVTEAPILSKANEAVAKEILADVQDRRMTYDEAAAEILSDEDISDKTKGKLINYLDWHLRQQDFFNSQVLRKAKYEKKYLNEYSLTGSGETTKFLSADTQQDVFGEEVQFDAQSKEKQLLANVVDDSANMVGLAKLHSGSDDPLVFGTDMLSHIDKMPDGPDGQGVKKLLAITGLHNELNAERTRLIAERGKAEPERQKEIDNKLKQINKMIAQVEVGYTAIVSDASNKLNAARSLRVYRNTFFKELYADRILSDAQKRNKEHVETALQHTDVPDKVAEEGALREEKEAAPAIDAIISDKNQSEAGKNVESDINKPTEKKDITKAKGKNLVERIKEKVRKTKAKEEGDVRKEVVDKSVAEEKANEYLAGETIESLFEKAKEQTKKPC